MKEFIDVSEAFYRDFLKWGNHNIGGFHYEVITVADRTVIKNSENEVIAYRNLAYVETFHIRNDIMHLLIFG